MIMNTEYKEITHQRRLNHFDLKSNSTCNMYLDASRLSIYPSLFTSPLGDSCILFTEVEVNSGGYLPHNKAAR